MDLKFPKRSLGLMPQNYSADVLALWNQRKQSPNIYQRTTLVCLLVGTFTFIGYLLISYLPPSCDHCSRHKHYSILDPTSTQFRYNNLDWQSRRRKRSWSACEFVLVVQQGGIEHHFLPNVLGLKHWICIRWWFSFVVGCRQGFGGVLGMILLITTYAVVKPSFNMSTDIFKTGRKSVI